MVLGAVSGLTYVNIVLVIIIAAYFIYELYSYIRRRQVSTMLDEAEFQAGMRKAQVIDLREKKDLTLVISWGHVTFRSIV